MGEEFPHMAQHQMRTEKVHTMVF